MSATLSNGLALLLREHLNNPLDLTDANRAHDRPFGVHKGMAVVEGRDGGSGAEDPLSMSQDTHRGRTGGFPSAQYSGTAGAAVVTC